MSLMIEENSQKTMFAPKDRESFVNAFADIYEHSAWVAEQAFDTLSVGEELTFEKMTKLMASQVDGSGAASQLALLRAHPDLAGRLAIRGGLTDASQSEQQSAGLDQCSPEQAEKFQRLNGAYKTKFGFPFIIAVSGMNREDILHNFASRLENTTEREFQTALQEVHKIARIRLANIFNGAGK